MGTGSRSETGSGRGRYCEASDVSTVASTLASATGGVFSASRLAAASKWGVSALQWPHLAETTHNTQGGATAGDAPPPQGGPAQERVVSRPQPPARIKLLVAKPVLASSSWFDKVLGCTWTISFLKFLCEKIAVIPDPESPQVSTARCVTTQLDPL